MQKKVQNSLNLIRPYIESVVTSSYQLMFSPLFSSLPLPASLPLDTGLIHVIRPYIE